MKKIYLCFLLVFGMFAQQGWAPPPGQGGATGGAAAAPDISKCDLNPSKQTKVKAKGRDGKEYFICTGQAICGGKAVPVSCKVSERESCPTAIKCISLNKTPGKVTLTKDADYCRIKFILLNGTTLTNENENKCNITIGEMTPEPGQYRRYYLESLVKSNSSGRLEELKKIIIGFHRDFPTLGKRGFFVNLELLDIPGFGDIPFISLNSANYVMPLK